MEVSWTDGLSLILLASFPGGLSLPLTWWDTVLLTGGACDGPMYPTPEVRDLRGDGSIYGCADCICIVTG